MADLRKWAAPPEAPSEQDDEDDETSDVEPTLAYVPQKLVRMLEDDEESRRAYAAFEFFLAHADELEQAVAAGIPWPRVLTDQAREVLTDLDDVWLDGVADALTGETMTIDAGMTAISNWFRRHVLR